MMRRKIEGSNKFNAMPGRIMFSGAKRPTILQTDIDQILFFSTRSRLNVKFVSNSKSRPFSPGIIQEDALLSFFWYQGKRHYMASVA